MRTEEIKILLHKFFNGESSAEDEKLLYEYFSSEEVDEEVKEYAPFFGGIAELASNPDASGFEEDIMDYILENETKEKSRYRWMWQTVTGVAASILIVLGGILFYEQQKQPFEDTFKNPDKAYVYAEKTLQYVAGKYATGLAELSKVNIYNKGIHELDRMDKLEQASKPLSVGVKQINKGFNEIDELKDL